MGLIFMNISQIENHELSMCIYNACMDAGFADCGIIAIEDMEGYISKVRERIGKVPSSAGFYQNAVRNTEKIKALFPWAKSIVVCLSWLGKFRYPKELQGMYAKSFFVSRDSDRKGPEYQQKLKIGEWFDAHHIQWTGSIKEGGASIWGLRHAAQAAGLGSIRKNNFLYNENGSWLELDAFLIDRHCRLYQEKDIPACPSSCKRCQSSCPTGALCAPHTLNPGLCVSNITTFSKGVVPPGIQEERLGSWMAGCDACQDACPFNIRHDWTQGENFPGLDALVGLMQPENILLASEEELAERVCSLTAGHILPENASTLKANAKRVLRNRERTRRGS